MNFDLLVGGILIGLGVTVFVGIVGALIFAVGYDLWQRRS